jgi:hypothetical protein
MIKPIDLMIVGAQKSGTTSLFNYLSQHPSIHTHPQREFAFFVNDSAYNQGYDEAYKRYFGKLITEDSVLLAKHVMLMYSQEAVKRLHNHNPGIQIIVVLRNPIDRAYSAYWYARRRGWEHLKTFEEGLKAEEKRLNDSWMEWRNCAYINNSTYDLPVQSLLEYFDRNQIHYILTEDLHNRPSEICKKLFELFQIDQDFEPVVGIKHNPAAMARSELLARFVAWLISPQNYIKQSIRRIIPSSWTYKLRHTILRFIDKPFNVPEIKSDTRKKLMEYFVPINAKLSELIERDTSKWNQ